MTAVILGVTALDLGVPILLGLYLWSAHALYCAALEAA